MNRYLTLFAAAALCFTTTTASANDGKDVSQTVPQETHLKPWLAHDFDFETGFLWKVGGSTKLNYRLAPVMLSWRSPEVFGFSFSNGSYLTLRNRVTLIGEWVETGPENHYFGIMGAPSFEWFSPSTKWSIYGNIGGGIGLIDSQGVVGGQGQDFTLTWYAATGVSYRLTDTFSLRTGAMFQHLSNGGATDSNPGVNVLGFTIGAAWSF